MLVVAYDSDCGACSRFRSVVGLLDYGRRLRFMDLKQADRVGLLDDVPRSERFASFHLVDTGGRTVSGAEALSSLARLFPGGRVFALVLGRKGMPSAMAAFAYGVLSRLHESGSCSTSGKPSGGPTRRNALAL